MANKIYHLYPSGAGFSNNTVDYHGTLYAVAAVNNRQARYFAHNDVWATDASQPQGIVEIYQRGAGEPGDHRLWCGCQIFGGLGLQHMEGVRAIRAAMHGHLKECQAHSH
ncbi:hypothetical protein [Nocardioides pocheonensis]|uniref:Uncharacterized protein n=1 Tax=Nocardioides pocheonensis TaxID=661485 RepID=A0A3N0GGY8_9ACTN|nr:hypothetical protein [Nocardioides pocheonensis]RNM11734.1 hypothetical protein EFL26_21495 [Nocardioides pocheonensis]